MRTAIEEVLASVLSVPLDTVASSGFGPQVCAEWDSFRHLQIVIALERRFGCVFEPHDIPRLVSVPTIAAVLQRSDR